MLCSVSVLAKPFVPCMFILVFDVGFVCLVFFLLFCMLPALAHAVCRLFDLCHFLNHYFLDLFESLLMNTLNLHLRLSFCS